MLGNVEIPNDLYACIRMYMRCSDPRQERKRKGAGGDPSIQAQREALHKRAEEIPHGRIVDHYVDEGQTGWKIPYEQRTGLQLLLQEAEAGDLVMAWDAKRLARRTFDLSSLFRQFCQLRVDVLLLCGIGQVAKFEFSKEGMPAALSAMIVSILEFVANYESEQRSAYGKRTREYKKNHGLWAGGNRWPIGRRVVKRTNRGLTAKVLVWDEEELEHMREFWDRFQAGELLSQIALDFYERDVRNAQGRLMLPFYTPKGTNRTLARPCVAAYRQLMEFCESAGVPDPSFLHPTTLEPMLSEEERTQFEEDREVAESGRERRRQTMAKARHVRKAVKDAKREKPKQVPDWALKLKLYKPNGNGQS